MLMARPTAAARWRQQRPRKPALRACQLPEMAAPESVPYPGDMATATTVLLLVGPKGSGKTFIGSLIRERLGVPVLPVEPIFQENQRSSLATGPTRDAEAYAKVSAEVTRLLAEHPRVTLESTGASEAFPSFLSALRARHRVLLVSVRAPAEACLERVRTRDPTAHIDVSADAVVAINLRSASVRLAWDLELDNGGPAAPQDIVDAIRSLLNAKHA
jgi:shikimate kinase